MYACSWPAYLSDKDSDKILSEIKENCNYWRNYGDIVDSFNSVASIIDFFGDHGQVFARYHGKQFHILLRDLFNKSIYRSRSMV